MQDAAQEQYRKFLQDLSGKAERGEKLERDMDEPFDEADRVAPSSRQRAACRSADWAQDRFARHIEEEDRDDGSYSASECLARLYRRLIALNISASNTRGVLRAWMGAPRYDEGEDRADPQGRLAKLVTAVADLEIVLEDISALIGDD